jgi:serine/threonine protein kinase
MAPELFSSEGVHSYSTDFWALGCLMFELRMNHTPFTSRRLRDQHVGDDRTSAITSTSSGYHEEIDGTPQDILENIRKYPLSVIVEMMIERSQQRVKAIQRTKSPNKQNNSKTGGNNSSGGGSSGGNRDDTYVPTISPELMDLLSWLLERAPPYRCDWYERTHIVQFSLL